MNIAVLLKYVKSDQSLFKNDKYIMKAKCLAVILPYSKFVEKFLIGSHLRLELFPHTKCQKKLSEMLVNIINESENYFGHFLSDDAVPNWTSSLFHKILLHVNSQHFFLSL